MCYFRNDWVFRVISSNISHLILLMTKSRFFHGHFSFEIHFLVLFGTNYISTVSFSSILHVESVLITSLLYEFLNLKLGITYFCYTYFFRLIFKCPNWYVIFYRKIVEGSVSFYWVLCIRRYLNKKDCKYSTNYICTVTKMHKKICNPF